MVRILTFRNLSGSNTFAQILTGVGDVVDLLTPDTFSTAADDVTAERSHRQQQHEECTEAVDSEQTGGVSNMSWSTLSNNDDNDVTATAAVAAVSKSQDTVIKNTGESPYTIHEVSARVDFELG